MSLIKANAVQIGQSTTATQNFTLAVPSSPDGTIKLARGNSGATTQDVMNVSNAGVVSFPQGLGNISNSTAISTGSTTARSLANRFADVVNVKDFGAVGDGVTDDTAAIQNAIDTCFQIGVNGGGIELFFPKGTYVCKITIDGYAPGNDVGENSITINGYAATLKGRASDTSIIQINGAVANIVDPNPYGNIYANGIVIQGLTLDMSNMANTVAVYGIAAQHSYACTIKDIHVYADPSLGGGLFLGSQTYTWTIINLTCNRVKLKGYNSGDNIISIHNFYNLDAVQVLLENCFCCGFYGGTLQGPIDHFVFTGAQTISIFGMDIEGPNTGEVVYKINSNCRAIVSIGNAMGGYTLDSYSSGYAPNSNFSDRPNFAGLNGIGTYGRTTSQGQVAVTTSPTPIYKFKDTQVGQNYGLFLVSGDNGTDGFQDLIMVAFGVVTIIKSQDIYGSPAARNYTISTNELRASYASGLTVMRPVCMEFLQSSL